MPVFIYTPLVPQANQQKNVSQPIMEQNSQAIPELITQNHEDFNTPDFGKHSFVTLMNRTGNTPVFGNFEGIWSENGTTGVTEIWVNTKAGAGYDNYQMTASVLSLTPTPGNASNGWSSTPAGIIYKWGTMTFNGDQVFNYPVAATIPVFSQVFNCQLTPIVPAIGPFDVQVSVISAGLAGIRAYGSLSSNPNTATPVTCFYYVTGIQ